MKIRSNLSFVLILFFNSLAHAQATLLCDINTSGHGAPREIIKYGSELIFSADDGISGREIWKSDGVNCTMIGDLNPTPGVGSADYNGSYRFFEFQGELFFHADDGITGLELWKYDGVNISQVADINTGMTANSNSVPDNFIEFDNKLFFTAQDTINNIEVWYYDGVTTNQLADINTSGSGIIGQPEFCVSGNKLFFIADDGSTGQELWVYNGISTGMVDDINISGSGVPYWASLTNYNNEVYFRANDGINGYELWKSDGVTMSMVVDLNSIGDSWPDNLIVFNSKLYFSADNGIFGSELWQYDGNSTTLVVDWNPSGYTLYEEMTIVGNNLFFRLSPAPLSIGGIELGYFDGASVQFYDTYAAGSGNAASLATNGTYLFFSAWDSNLNAEPWVCNGNSVYKIAEVNSNGASNPGGFTEFQNKVYFIATDNGTYGQEIWYRDLNYLGLEDIEQTNNDRKIVEIIDFMGRETEFKPNTPLIYIYSDGTRERVMKLED